MMNRPHETRPGLIHIKEPTLSRSDDDGRIVIRPATGEAPMSYKTVLVHFENTPRGITRLEIAARIAEQHDAHLTALVLDILPNAESLGGLETPPSVVHEILAMQEAEAARQREATLAALDAQLTRFSCRTQGVVTRCRSTGIASALAVQARYADLLVLGQAAGDSLVDRLVVEEVLLSSGLPLLVVPAAATPRTVGQNVLVAWDGSREAARAVGDAIPLIDAAKAVTVLAVQADSATGSRSDDIAVRLARHNSQVEVATRAPLNGSVADAILSAATDIGSDVLVMGGYGHSRMRELIMGGVTRSVLAHMTVPVLFSH